MQAYERLETALSEWCGIPNVVACSSGTAALHLALEAMQLPLGSEVIVPDFTMVACARAVTLAGLKPVFVDCDETLNISLHQLADMEHSASLKAALAVHIYGRQVDIKQFKYLVGNNTKVIEDLAEAHGIEPHPLTDAACYSFYKNKIVAGEEGGAVAFRDKRHADLARQLRSLGFTEAHDFTHIPRGHNYRMSNAHAGIILDQWNNPYGCLQQVTVNLELRREIERWYDEFCPIEWMMPNRDMVWVYDIRIPGMISSTQNLLVRELRAVGIEARHGFKPMTEQTEYRPALNQSKVRFDTQALKASREVIYLPVQPGKTMRSECERAMGHIERLVS